MPAFDAFTVTATVNRPEYLDAQWYRDGQAIAGATELSYTIDPVTEADDGAQYVLHLSNGIYSLVSDSATLNVTADTTAPSLEEVSLLSDTSIHLSFSEGLDPSSVSDLSAYQIAWRGLRVPVKSAVLSEDGDSLVLNVATALEGNYVLELTSTLSDLAGNLLANTQWMHSQRFEGTLLIDFGNSASSSTDSAGSVWNNVTTTIGTSNTGALESLKSSTGEDSSVNLQMIARFQGANTSGTRASTPYPSTAESWWIGLERARFIMRRT